MRIKERDYWKWQYHVYDMENKKLKVEYVSKCLEAFSLRQEVSGLRAESARLKMVEAVDNKTKAESEYNQFKEDLEKKLDVDLSNVCIKDDLTIESIGEATDGTN